MNTQLTTRYFPVSLPRDNEVPIFVGLISSLVINTVGRNKTVFPGNDPFGILTKTKTLKRIVSETRI